MAVRVSFSRNALSNLDGKRMSKVVGQNLFKVGSVAGENANLIAPLDTGDLRNSRRLEKGVARVVNVWTVSYAEKVYFTNRKNPHTTRWAERDFEENGDEYLEKMKEGVVL